MSVFLFYFYNVKGSEEKQLLNFVSYCKKKNYVSPIVLNKMLFPYHLKQNDFLIYFYDEMILPFLG